MRKELERAALLVMCMFLVGMILAKILDACTLNTEERRILRVIDQNLQTAEFCRLNQAETDLRQADFESSLA